VAIELVDDARTSKCVLSLRVDGMQPHPEGGYILEGSFARPLTADEWRDLVG
jgi:hypothetical protein